MRTATTILVILALPLPDGDCLQFESPVTGTSNQSSSIGEEAHVFDGALLAGVHRPMQAQRRAPHYRGTSCGTVAPHAFVPSAATCHVDINVAQSGRCCGISLHSSPSFFPSHYIASISIISISPPLPRHGLTTSPYNWLWQLPPQWMQKQRRDKHLDGHHKSCQQLCQTQRGGSRPSRHGVLMNNNEGKGQCQVDGTMATWHIREEEETAASCAKPAQSKK
jgi:hypothetical protein